MTQVRSGPGWEPLPVAPAPAVVAKPTLPAPRLAWITLAASGAPYFTTEAGEAFTPIGHNEAISWPTLMGLLHRKDWRSVDAYLGMCARHGVTVLRLMLEYSQQSKWHLENPDGTVKPHMLRLWDDLVALCELHSIRLLLTPLDTFWMMRRWRQHPYNQANGGPCGLGMRGLLTCTDTRKRLFDRLAFATDRWGGTGVIFAWDLWNELDPKYAQGQFGLLADWISETSHGLRQLELRLHGRSHLQVVSTYSPTIAKLPALKATCYAHPDLDFASNHLYGHPHISDPRNTVAPAVELGQMTAEGIASTPEGRPFLDTEHGPIFHYLNRGSILPEPFDDEMFGHMQWAHVASGGAGGGFRWPYRHPHALTPGMHRHQQALAAFLPLVDWPRFRRTPWNGRIRVSAPADAVALGCGDAHQAVVYVLRNDLFSAAGQLAPHLPPLDLRLTLPDVAAGTWTCTAYDPQQGGIVAQWQAEQPQPGALQVALPPLRHDLVLALRRLPARSQPRTGDAAKG